MKKIFYLILIFIMASLYLPLISLADGGLFTQLDRDIYEPNQLAMIVFDDMVEKIWTKQKSKKRYLLIFAL